MPYIKLVERLFPLALSVSLIAFLKRFVRLIWENWNELGTQVAGYPYPLINRSSTSVIDVARFGIAERDHLGISNTILVSLSVC